jgi:hypothetical protein
MYGSRIRWRSAQFCSSFRFRRRSYDLSQSSGIGFLVINKGNPSQTSSHPNKLKMVFFNYLIGFIALLPFFVIASLEYPDLVLLKARQTPGTPAYECHEACGRFLVTAMTSK